MRGTGVQGSRRRLAFDPISAARRQKTPTSGAPRGVRMVAQSIRAASWLNGCGFQATRLAALRCPSSSTDAGRRAGISAVWFRGQARTPPPCGEGQGWGSESSARRWEVGWTVDASPATAHPAAPPPPLPLPTRGRGIALRFRSLSREGRREEAPRLRRGALYACSRVNRSAKEMPMADRTKVKWITATTATIWMFSKLRPLPRYVFSA